MSVDQEAFGSDSIEPGEGDFVPVLFARNLEEAEEYCDLLSDHDIPARPGMDDEVPDEEEVEQQQASRRGMTHGVAVLVPETLLDEASEVIADRDEFGEFEEDDEDVDDEDDEALGLTGLDSQEALLDDEEDDELLDEVDDEDDLDDVEDNEEELY